MAIGTRLTSWLLIIGGGFFATLFILFSLGEGQMLHSVHHFFDDNHWFAHLLEGVSMGTLAVGIAGLYFLLRDRLGRLGRAGLVIGAVGLGIEALAGFTIAIFEPWTGIDFQSGAAMALTHAPGVIGNFLGGLLFAIALLRGNVFPRFVAVPFAALAIGGLLMMFAPIGEGPRLAIPAVVALAWAWIGIAQLIALPEGKLTMGAVVVYEDQGHGRQRAQHRVHGT